MTDSETPAAQASAANLSITITVAPLSVTTTSGSLPLGVVSTAYPGATLQATGGIQPYAWSVTTGSLPAGLTLNPATGAISGTPTASGTVSFTVTVTDAETPTAKTATANLSIVVNPAVSVTTSSLPAGVIGTAYPAGTMLQAAGGVSPYTWAVTTGSLPAGLTLNASTGAISGTPSGTFTSTTNFTVTVTDNESPTKKTATANLSIAISAPALSVKTTSLAGGTVGNAYTNQTLQAAGGIAPYTWTVTTGSLPVGLSLNASTGAISGTPSGTFVGTDSFTVTATDSETPTAATANANLSITITVAALGVTTSGSLTVGVVNSAYPGATLQATGGIQPYTWSVTTGSLPAGLTLNPATGAISGTPTASGNVNFTVTVTDAETPTAKTATANLSIGVNPALSVTTTSPLPAGVIGTAYSKTLAASGGIAPYTWVASALPSGLSLNAATGVISGTPGGTFTGTMVVTVTVTDSESPQNNAAAPLNITISAPAFSVTTTTLAGGTVGNAYTNQTLQATGGVSPYTWSVTTGSLPVGLSLNAATGVISGTPSGTFVGTDSFTVTATDSETPTHATATANLSITITVATLSVTTTSGSLPLGVVSTAYPGATLQATGGIQPYAWSVTTGSLPAGLTLNPATGAISGTPTASGTVNFTVTVTDAETPTAKTATAALTIVVNPAVSVTTNSLPAGVIGTAYPAGTALQAAGGVSPYTWAVTTGSLPAGLTLNAATGAISGTPSGTFVGTVNFTVTVTDNESPTKKTATANLGISITAPALSVTTASLAGGSIGNAYTNQTLQASGGIAPYTWAVTTGSLPTGLSLNASTGVISGTPSGTFVGTDSFTVTATDSETPTGATANRNLSITITVATLSVTTTSSQLPLGVVSTTYPGATLQATGGIQPYVWSVTTGSLPAGLTLNPATGAISGTPTSSGTVNFTVTVTDAETPTAKTATANLSIVVNPAVSVTTTTLPSGAIGTAYPAGTTLQAAGGVSPYTWAVTTGSLPAGLTLNAATGAISGTPNGTFVGVVNFTVTVTDNESPTKKTASANLSITISVNTLTVTSTTASLPTGVINNSYSTTLQASGGVMPYTWTQTGGNLPAGLTLNANGTISGTPTALGPASFTVQVQDSETPTKQTAFATLSISINNSAPLTVTTTSSQLPSGLTGITYPGATLQATGGVQPYSWSYTGSLPTGLSLSAGGAITGTPSAAGTFNFTARVTDSTSPTPGTATAGLSITVTTPTPLTLPPAGPLPPATVNQNYSGGINASGGIGPNYSFTVNGSAVPTDGSQVAVADGIWISNSGGNSLLIGGTPTAVQTVTLSNVSVTDSASNSAGPFTYTIAVINPAAAYTVSGTVTYGGSKSGWTYLQLSNNNCCGSNLGTSISKATLTAGGAFTIHGVPPGTYTLQAYIDNLSPSFGAQNASNPTGSVSNITVTNAPVTGVPVILGDAGTVTINSAPNWNPNSGLGTFSGGAFVSFQTIQNNNTQVEIPASYNVGWSTSASCNPSSFAGTKSFPATGGRNPWIVTGLTTGQTYYFCAQGVATGGSTGPWSAPSPSSGLKIAVPTGNTISGKVTFSETATGPLYVGFYDQNTGNMYVTVVGSKTTPPTSPASYTVQVPSSTYYFFGVIDQNNSGLISGPGQVSNTNENNMAPVVISGPLSNENLTLPNTNSIATVMTQSTEQVNSGGTSYNYSLGFNVNGLLKLPVAVELTTGPSPGAVIPADIATGAFNGSSDQFSFWTSLNGATPQVGDVYTLNVTYSDNTSQVLTVTVGAVLNNAFVTNLLPQGNGVSTTPNFSWTYPSNASSYTYQFWLCCGPNGTIWQIPSNNVKSNGFSSSTPSFITWGTDPTNPNPPNPPNPSSLNGSTFYSWQIQATDVNGNSAQVQVNFQTMEVPLSLPAPGSLGTATVGQNWNGAINASGGISGYSFTVNGNTIPGDNSQVPVADGLWVSSNTNTGGTTLSIGGTPSAVQTVTLNVSVTDSTSTTVGPYAYTISVIAGAPLSFSATPLPSGNTGWVYSTYLQANGGVQPYTWSVSSGNLPAGLSIDPSSGQISGTPTAAGTPNFTVQVADSETPPATASQALSIAITNCSYTLLNGHYAFMANGWSSSTTATSAVGSFVADGLGNISGGLLDVADQAKSTPSNGAFTGKYCVNSSNNLATMIFNFTAPLTGSSTLAAALDATDGNGHMISFDNTGALTSGLLRKQQTTAFSTGEIKNNYAFELVGSSGGSSRFAMAGEFNSTGSGTLSGEVDADSGGSGSGSGPVNVTLSASDFSVASTGRGTASITFTSEATINFAFYVVNSSEMLMMAVDTSQTPPMVIAGQVLQQSGSFTNASLNGVSVIEMQGGDSQSSPNVTAGFVTTNGAGSFSINADQNQAGTMGTLSGSGTYSVSSNGRMTLTGVGSNPPVFYLISQNQAFVVGTDNSVTVGKMTPQVGSGFTNASLNGSYLGGSQPPQDWNVKAEILQIHADGAGNMTGTQDEDSENHGGAQSNTIPALTYAPAVGGPAGKFVISQGGVPQVYLYIINATSGSGQAVLMPVSSSQNQDNNPKLDDFHQ